jgi:hypothetical protein
MPETLKAALGFWPFAAKSDIRAADDKTEWRNAFTPRRSIPFAGLAQR